jgi:hypothetical protein
VNDTTHTNGRIEQSERQKAVLSPGEVDLRDYFAAKAMQSLLTTIDEFPDEHWRTGVATDAYSMADAMLAARKGGMQP